MLALSLLTLLAAPPAVVRAEPLPAWDARFRPTEGWVGGDGAYSVPVSPTRTVWLFGDTWVGSVRDGKRVGVAMVNNTAAVQEGRGADAKLTFVVRRDAGKPVSLLDPIDGRGWFWPQAGACHGGRLYLFLAQVEKAPGGGAFGFKLTGQWLAVVENPDDEPTAWKVTQHKLPWAEFGDRKLAFGSMALAAGDHLYVYGYEEPPRKGKGRLPDRRLVLARVPLDKVADFTAWRFYADGGWKTEAKSLATLADGVGTEGSVSYLPGRKQYVAVYTDHGLSDRIVGRFADRPEGPWSEPVLLYRCPEMRRDKRVFTYAAKAHPELAGDDELVVSYCVNSFELAPVINDASLYWPTFVRVELGHR